MHGNFESSTSRKERGHSVIITNISRYLNYRYIIIKLYNTVSYKVNFMQQLKNTAKNNFDLHTCFTIHRMFFVTQFFLLKILVPEKQKNRQLPGPRLPRPFKPEESKKVVRRDFCIPTLMLKMLIKCHKMPTLT